MGGICICNGRCTTLCITVVIGGEGGGGRMYLRDTCPLDYTCQVSWGVDKNNNDIHDTGSVLSTATNSRSELKKTFSLLLLPPSKNKGARSSTTS